MRWLKQSILLHCLLGALPLLFTIGLMFAGIQSKGFLTLTVIIGYGLLLQIYGRLGMRVITFNAVAPQSGQVLRSYEPVMVWFIVVGVFLLFGFGIGPQVLAIGFVPALLSAWTDGTIAFLLVIDVLFVALPLFLARYVKD